MAVVVKHKWAPGMSPVVREILNVVARTGDGVFAVDEALRIVLWNAAAQELLGYTPEEVLGRPCYEVTCGRDSHGNLLCYPGCPIASMARRGEFIRHYDMLVRCRSGEDRWIDMSTIILPCRSGLGCLAIHLFRDVSREKALVRLVENLATWGLLPPVEGHSPLSTLTPREREILQWMAQGAGTREIATKLYISPLTVRNHIHNIFRKLGARSRAEAVAVALRYGLKIPQK